jgi:carboxyl-terminal processing protease
VDGAADGATPTPIGGSAAVSAELAVQTFDSAWSRIAHTHYDTAFGGVDWAAVRTELRPRAEAARSMGELRRVLMDMVGRLGLSHFAVLPREAAGALDGSGGGATEADAGLEVRIAGDELVVWRLDPAGAAAAAGVGTGWTVLEIDGRSVGQRLDALRTLPAAERRRARTTMLYQLNAELKGGTGAERELKLRTGEGREIRRRLQLRTTEGEVVAFGSLPPVVAVLHGERVTVPGGCAGVIRFTMWLVPLSPAFDRAVDAARDCAGIVIDLRGNPGGVAGMVMGTAGHFLDDTLRLGFMKTRTTELRFKANPRRVRADGSTTQPFAGRVAILMDEMSASTSEFFAEGLQRVGRARVFGTPSAGQALPAALVRLPNGDVLMHVIADFTGPDGSRIEGRGVVPDVVVETTREDLLQQRDAVMSAALAWIAGSPPAHPEEGQP